MQTTPTPATVRASLTMARIRQTEARRRNLRRAGVSGALTRAELAAAAARKV
jgi:hypothetical protein